MGAYDDIIGPSSAASGGAYDDIIVSQKPEGGIVDKVKKGLTYAKDTGVAIAAGAGEGVAGTEAGIGTFLQAPAANTLAGVMGARALADRGLTAAGNFVSPGSMELNPRYQEAAQQASGFAAEQRAANVQDGGALASVGSAMQDDGRYRVQAIREAIPELSPELARQQQEYAKTEGFVGSLKGMIDNPLSLVHTLSRSAPDMVAGAAAAKGVASGLAAAGKSTAAQVAGASTAGMVAESMSSANQTREGVYQQVSSMPLEQLAASPRYREIVTQVGDPAKAREALANELADQATLLAGAGTMAGSALTNRLFGGDTTAQIIAGAQRTTGKTIAKNMGQEGTEEVLQGVPEDLAQHGAVSQADPNAKFDLGKTVAENFVAGAALGGVGSTGAFISERSRPRLDPLPDTGPMSRAANIGIAAGAVQAAEAIGAPAAIENPLSQAAGIQPEQPQQEQANPVSLSAPEDVRALDAEIAAADARLAELNRPGAGYGPTFDAERADVAAKRGRAAQARDAATANWPKVATGKKTEFSTENGNRLEATYALAPAASLRTSHDEALRPAADYPAELQPRQRDRAASEMQISSMVSRLDPARLGESPDAATGAPIIGPDGLVESGNARTIALKRVYQSGGQKANEYKQFLIDNADRFGITPESVQAMENPVLVRVRDTPVNRAEFARQANASTVAQMSPAEQAKADAQRIDVMDDLRPDDNGDFATSRDFIRRFMGKLPATEQAGMIDADGRLSQSGYARVRNAIIAKAYGDSPVLTRMVESLDDNLRNIGKALMMTAPTVAKLRQDVADGALFAADITPELLAAVEELSRLRDAGKSVREALSQAGMFGDAISAEAQDLLRFLDENIRKPRKIAEFIQRYTEALRSAGNPNQGSLLGETQAPSKRSIINAVLERAQNEAAAKQSEQQPQGDQGAGQEAGARRENPQGSGVSDQGSEQKPANSEWVIFPPESGTLGIPRAEMPQVKGEHRGALIAFLKAQGIDYTTHDMDAEAIKPTQAEFSLKKAARWGEVRDGVDRSVLVSSDGYILDGHHQWIAALAAGESVQAIEFNAPIKELLFAVHQFPSVQRSEGAASDGKRAQAREDFKEALADLGAILRDFAPVARMVPEKTPDLMPTLVRLFKAGLTEVGYNLKDLIAYVKKLAKSDPATKAVWNKIKDDTYRKAARQAIDEALTAPAVGAAQGDLFAAPAAKAAAPAQADLFSAMAPEKPKAAAEKVAMIDGRPYDMKRDNFKPAEVDSFLPAGVLAEANGYVDKYFKDRPAPALDPADVKRAEEMLSALIEKAKSAKADYDQKIIDIAKRSGAMGQMIAPIKGMPRSVQKLIVDEGFNIGGMKDMLRSTIVVSDYTQAQAVMDEIAKEFTLTRKPKNRTGSTALVVNGEELQPEDPKKYGGYTDVLVNITMPNGVIAEIQINVPEMLSAKEAQGHKLYEAYRDAPKDSPLGREINASMLGFYQAAFDAAQARSASASAKNSASDRSNHSPTGPLAPMAGLGSSASPSSDMANQAPSGNSTKKPPSDLSANRQPSGNAAGTFISTTSNDSIADGQNPTYTNDNGNTNGVANEQRSNASAGSTEEPAAQAVQATVGGRNAERVRGDARGRDQRGDRQSDNADRTAAWADGNDQPAGQGSDVEGGRKPGKRGSAGRNAGVPAGRDIPAKTGRNYAFGDGDLTYDGSWLVKARQNVEALELLKQLEKDGRQATRDEQAVLAKFIGWGASDIANSIFGDKLDKQLSLQRTYDEAVAAFERAGKDALYRGGRVNGYFKAGDSGYYAAFNAINAKAGGSLNYYDPGLETITRAQVDAAKPDSSVKKWAELRDRIKSAMSKEEWETASRSTQYAHYTSKPVVQSMMRALERMGFNGGTVLEPGAGIGVFPGLMPVDMATNSAYTGIEFDHITGGILAQLFPDERILTESFIDTSLPDNYYDIGFGNPPFRNTPILSDPKYRKHGFSMHDYFFAKTMDSVKPGGLVVFVTSRYTMDKLDDKARAYLAERADLVGAIRLPQTAFKKNAGTDVVTDVLFLRKKVEGETFNLAQPWAKSVPMKVGSKSFPVNEYFHAHPEMVLGDHSDKWKMANSPEPQYTVEARPGDIEAMFDAAAATLPENVFVAGRETSAEAAQVRHFDWNPKAKKEGNYYIADDGKLMIRERGYGVAPELDAKQVPIVRDFIGLRDSLKQAHYDQLNDGDWQKSLAALQKSYRSFVKTHGRLHQFTTYQQRVKVDELNEDGEPTGEKVWGMEDRRRFPVLNALRDDPDWTLVAALESFNQDTGAISESQFLTERVLDKPKATVAETPTDAMLQTLNDIGHIDMGMIADRLGISEREAIESLGSLVYDDPSAGWQTADEYLSGDVRKKLKQAEAAAKTDKRYQRNVEALISVMPAPRTHTEIIPQIGMPWIPQEMYEQFLAEKAQISTTVLFNERTGQWHVSIDDSSYKKSFADRKSKRKGDLSMAATQDWGTDRRNAAEILEYALTGAPVRIMSKQDMGGGKTKDVFDATATEAAIAKVNQMREAFKSWLWEDQARIDKLVPAYNDRFNTMAPRKFDGSHMTLVGASTAWQRKAYPHVRRGAWRIVQQGNTYLAHAVGSGKTAQMVISAMEQKRLGLIKKPMFVVPNHMLAQFSSEWLDLYPAARLMVADEQNFTGDNRRRFVSRVAMSDLDGVIITQSAFKLLDLDPEFKSRMIEQELDYLRAALVEAGGKVGEKGQSRDPKVKQIENRIERLEQKLEAAMSGTGKDKNVRFDETGVDMLYVDEAHLFRKLSFVTQRQVKGIDPNGSDQSFDLWMKVQWLRENKNPKRNLVMASGTPVTNTMAELYTVQKFMDPDMLEERGLSEFDQWASMFGAESTAIEPDASGKYGPVTRFNKFVNVSELTQMFRDFADVLTSDYLANLLGDNRPKVKDGARKVTITPKTDSYAEFQKTELQTRMERSRNWKPSRDEPNNPDPIIAIIGDGRLAAIDMRFMNPSLPNDPDSKLNRMIDEIIRVHKQYGDMEYKDKAGKTEPNKGAAQIVFSDLGFGAGVAASRGFNARAWFEKRLRDAGIPPAQVAFMSDYKKSSDKLKLFAAVNTGKVRIVVGSSKNMGTGVNAQQRLIALHHLDAPWYPADLEQREGRIIRQGNKHAEMKIPVEIYAYASKGSYDEQMWSTLARKQFFIDQALSGDPNIREIEDLGEASQFDIAAAMVADDPRVLQLAGLRAEVEKLSRLYQAHEDSIGRLRRDYATAQSQMAWAERGLKQAEALAAKVQDISGDNFIAKAGGQEFTARKDWGAQLMTSFKERYDFFKEGDEVIGQVSGFDVVFVGTGGQNGKAYMAEIALRVGDDDLVLAQHPTADPVGVAMRAASMLAGVARAPSNLRQTVEDNRGKMSALEPRLTAQFPLYQMLLDKEAEARKLEDDIVGVGKNDGLAREQAIEDAWAERTGAITPLFSRGNGEPGMALRDLQAVVDRIAKQFKNLPTIHVLDSPSSLSAKDPAQKSLRDFIRKAGAWNDVEGATHEGDIYLFASGLADESRAEHVLATHEVTHYGLRGVMGKDLDAALQTILMGNDRVRKAAADMRDRLGLKSNIEAVEEVLADMGPGDLVKLKGWRRVVQAVRNWLQARGLTALAGRLDSWIKSGMDEQQRADLYVADLVNAARAWVRNGKGRSFMDGTRLADGSLAEDLAKQEAWLAAEAKARGYASIDELAEKNFKAFENLAKLWREKNPVEGALLSRSAMKDVDANIRRGRSALAKAISEKTSVHRAMFRNGVGWIDFVWGSEGKIKPSGRSSGAMGIAHIFEARARKDDMSEREISALLDAIVTAIAKGAEIRRIEHADTMNVTVDYDGIEAVLVKSPGSNAWVLNGWKVKPVVAGAGYVAPGATQSNTTTARVGMGAGFNSNLPKFSRAINSQTANQSTAAQRAEEIIQKPSASWRPVDAVMKALTQTIRLDVLTGKLYTKAGALLDHVAPENVKAGVISDYGVPEAVIDQRVLMQGRMRVQLRQTGELLEKLATLTRAESRVAYEWMNNADPQAAAYFESQLPAESVKVMEEVKGMVDRLSQEAVALGQLDPESFKRNRFEYLRRSYLKHTTELTKSETAGRKRAIAIMGDQYKGRGMVDQVDMAKFKNIAPEWWNRKLQAGQADKQLKGEKFIRLERRAPIGEGVLDLETAAGPGETNPQKKGRLLEVAYWPAGESLPAKYSTWDQNGTWEVRDTKGGKLVIWRDFTKQERVAMGEIDEARYAIAKTLHGMVHDVETGRYLEWVANTYGKQRAEDITGDLVEASDRMRDTFRPGEWVQVPETKIPGTQVAKYGKLSGRFIPGPIWNDVRQTVGFRFKPLGETYSAILSAWKTAKTALSPAVHTNNVMANFVMADWHDVTAGHIAKALRIILGASQRDGKGIIGRAGNVASRAGIADAQAAREIIARFQDSGANLGSWVTSELQKDQLEPLLDALEKELGVIGNTAGAMASVSTILQLFKAKEYRQAAAQAAIIAKGNAAAAAVKQEAGNLIDLYEAEDQVFRLAAWLKAKEDGASDIAAGKVARRSFLDYHINAPWIQAMRQTAFPFISFTYRSVPMLLDVVANKPHKILKLAAVAGAINALGYLLAGGDEDDERALLPEEKAGRIWGMVPKLIRMPWNDQHGSPVFLDIRRFVPVGDIFDTGQNHAALPLLPFAVPGGPLAIMSELAANKSQFTGKAITLETDTAAEKLAKVGDHLYKAFAPNIIVLPGTHAFSGVVDAGTGRTDAFGREQSVTQAVATGFGVKAGAYPRDALMMNAIRQRDAKLMEIDRNISQIDREFQRKGIDMETYVEKKQDQIAKKQRIILELNERFSK